MEPTDQDLQKLLAGIRIPPCPELLLQVMQEAARPHADIERIALPLRKDAGMTAALLKLANSPQFNRDGKITSVTQAISTLGLATTLNLLKNVSLMQSMAGSHPKFEKFWERSSQCAAIASRMARKVEGVAPDDAYLAALFHDCGIPVLMQNFPDYRSTLVAQGQMGQQIYNVEEAHYFTNHAVVGHLLARTWLLPQAVCQTILLHHDATVFSPAGLRVDKAVRQLIGLIYMAELVVDEFLCQHNPEWDAVRAGVLRDCDLTEQEFAELKDDMLAYLNGE